jgi:transcriptional regulator with XRE-family HTH domain
MTEKPTAGALVRQFRNRAGLSQLDLALEAGVSQRHLSFVETGRNAPSRDMIDLLAGSLSLSQLEHNALLLAAGFAPVKYRAADNPAAAPLIDAATRMLEWQMPNPAVILHEDWRIIDGNDSARRMVNYFSDGPDLLSLKGLMITDLIMDPRYMNGFITNLEEIAAYMQTQLGFDATGALAPHRVLEEEERPQAMLSLALERGDTRLLFNTTLVTVGTARDAQLGEIRIESFYPADAATAGFVRTLGREAVA